MKIKGKIITGIIAIIGGIIVALVMFFLNSFKLNASEQEKKIEGKLETEIFNEFKKDNEDDHNMIIEMQKDQIKQIKELFDTRFDDLKEYLKEEK